MFFNLTKKVFSSPNLTSTNSNITTFKRFRHEISKATIFASRILDDGSKFISRVPLKPVQITLDQLPPPLYKPRNLPPTTQLRKQQVDEMRQLRLEDPAKWTVYKLSQKFNCSQYFVTQVSRVPDSYVPTILERKKKLWDSMGFKRQLIHINRLRRRALW